MARGGGQDSYGGRGRGGSGAGTPNVGGRGAARGGPSSGAGTPPSGRGRGRGRGTVMVDMRTMALDYATKVGLHDGAPQGLAFQNGSASTSASPSTAPSRSYTPSYPAQNRTVQASHQPPRPARQQNTGFQRAGIGLSNRMPERFAHDPNLTKPVPFVKSSHGLDATMNREEHDKLLAQKHLQDLIASALTLQSPTDKPTDIPPPVTSGAPSKTRSRESANSHTLKQTAPATPSSQPAQPISLRNESQSAASVPKATVVVEDEFENDALFVIDSVGDKGKGRAQATGDVASVANGSATASAEEEEESDTEELWPRRAPQTSAPVKNVSSPTSLPSMSTSGPSRPAAPPAQPAYLPTKPYAQVITDGITFLSNIVKPSVPKLSAEAKEFVAAATAPTASRHVSRKQAKQQARERKAERKRAKRLGRRTQGQKDAAANDKQPRLDDSDVDWGSDGPPNGQEDSDDDSDEAMMDTSTATAQPVKVANGHGKARHSKRDQALDDYITNIAAQGSDSDGEDIMVRMTAFATSMSGGTGEHLTLDDLNDIAQIREEDSDDDMAYEERKLREEYESDEEAKKQFPVYVPDPPDWESDIDDERNKVFRADDEDEIEDPAKTSAWREAGIKLMADSSNVNSSEPSDDDIGSTESEEVANAPVVVISSDDESEDDDDEEDEDDGDLVIRSGKDDFDEMAVALGIEEELLIVEDDSDEDGVMKMAKPRRRNQDMPDFGGDEFMEQLQRQWKQDKQKKALKKQERLLKRLEQQPSRSNTKKAKRAKANAKGFLDDGEDADLMLSGGRVPQFHQLNEDIKNFIQYSGAGEFAFPPMDKKFRFAIHALADAYNLKSKSRGAGRDRHNVLYRTSHTTVRNADMRKVRKFLAVTESWSTGTTTKYTYERPKKGNTAQGATRNHEGAVVGEGADKIDSENIGHRMLAKMGWSEGMQIGKTGGLSEPIVAIVKTSKAGLGSGWVRYNRGTQLTSTE